MNNPLRYVTKDESWFSGETFYQAGFFQDDSGTVLQVVKNPSWLLPYIACFMVSVGMAVHFGIHLFGFLRRRMA